MPSLSDEAVSYLTTNYPFLVQDNLPANTYTCVADETVCVAVKAVFTASKDLSEDVVYEITKAMFDNQADLAKAQAKFGFLEPRGCCCRLLRPASRRREVLQGDRCSVRTPDPERVRKCNCDNA